MPLNMIDTPITTEAPDKGGRPLLFETPEALQKQIDAYFAECDPHPVQHTVYVYPKKIIKGKDNKEIKIDDFSKQPTAQVLWRISDQKPYLITGLANFLKTSRQTLINYEERDGFFDTIKAAKDKCEEFWEMQLLGSHATGPIFNLKNNYGWKDQTQTDFTSKGDKLGGVLILPSKKIDDENSVETNSEADRGSNS